MSCEHDFMIVDEDDGNLHCMTCGELLEELKGVDEK